MATRTKNPIPQEASTRSLKTGKIRNKPPFAFAYHAENCEIRGGAVIPDLSRVYLRAGVNNYKVFSNGTVSFSALDEDLARAHLTRIPFRQTQDGEAYFWTDADTGESFSIWEETYVGSSHVDFDVEGYVAWCQWLVAEGHVPAPADHILTVMLADERNTLRKARNTVRARPGEQWQVDESKARIAVIEAEIEKRKATAKPRRRSKTNLPEEKASA